MGSNFWEKIPAIQLSLFFMALMVISLFSLSATAYSEEITYSGTGKNLRDTPSWFMASAPHCLFPGAPEAPLVSDNKITIDYDPAAVGVKNPQFVIGGLGVAKSAVGNRVALTNGRVEKVIFGGFSDEADSENNIVTIKGGFVDIDVLGGQSLKSWAIRNAVNIGGGVVSQNVIGGWGYSRAANNVVAVRGGSIGRKVVGGFGDDDTFNNSVVVSGGSVSKDIIGGLSYEGAVMGNAVAIEGGSMSENVYGGKSEGGVAAGNTITVSGGTMDTIYGGWSDRAGAAENTVTIRGGSIGNDIYGGIGENGAMGNVVTVSLGSVSGTVCGGGSERGEVSNNAVTVSGGTVGKGVLGGLCADGGAVNNTVTISGSPNLEKAQLYGGVSYGGGDVFTGNTLMFKSRGISAKAVGNFERYKFYLPDSAAADGTMLSVTEPVDLEGTTVEIFLQAGGKFNKGDKIALIHSAEGVGGAPKNKSCKAQQGGSLYEFSIHTDSNNLWAQVTRISAAAK